MLYGQATSASSNDTNSGERKHTAFPEFYTQFDDNLDCELLLSIRDHLSYELADAKNRLIGLESELVDLVNKKQQQQLQQQQLQQQNQSQQPSSTLNQGNTMIAPLIGGGHNLIGGTDGVATGESTPNSGFMNVPSTQDYRQHTYNVPPPPSGSSLAPGFSGNNNSQMISGNYLPQHTSSSFHSFNSNQTNISNNSNVMM